MFDPRVDSIISELKRLNQHFCKKVKCCLGISPQGDSNLVLNQQGDWITAGSGGDIQTLLSDLPEYLGAKEASEDGKPLDYWYYNTFFNTVSKVTQYIDTFSSGTSTIDFINNGGDDWDISFLATPTTLQSSANITGYQYSVEHWISGVVTTLESGFKTTDYTLNTSGNGAGVYNIYQTYILDNGTFFRIVYLVKVNATGSVLASLKLFGGAIISVNGLSVNVSANSAQIGVNYPISWLAFNTFPPVSFTPIGTGSTVATSLPLDAIAFGYTMVLDSVFTDDFTDTFGSFFSVTIS